MCIYIILYILYSINISIYIYQHHLSPFLVVPIMQKSTALCWAAHGASGLSASWDQPQQPPLHHIRQMGDHHAQKTGKHGWNMLKPRFLRDFFVFFSWFPASCFSLLLAISGYNLPLAFKHVQTTWVFFAQTDAFRTQNCQFQAPTEARRPRAWLIMFLPATVSAAPWLVFVAPNEGSIAGKIIETHRISHGF